jgi:hypothetical protein
MESCAEVRSSYECVAELRAVDVRGRVNIVEPARRRASGDACVGVPMGGAGPCNSQQ